MVWKVGVDVLGITDGEAYGVAIDDDVGADEGVLVVDDEGWQWEDVAVPGKETASGVFFCSCRLDMVSTQSVSVSKRKMRLVWSAMMTLFSEAVMKKATERMNVQKDWHTSGLTVTRGVGGLILGAAISAIAKSALQILLVLVLRPWRA